MTDRPAVLNIKTQEQMLLLQAVTAC